MRESPNTRTEATVTPQDPPASKIEARKKPKVHSLIDKVFSRKHLELVWERVKKNRGSAGIDDVTIAAFEERKESYLDLLHRKLREGTYQPKPVKRVEIAKSDGGLRKRGIPAVLDRVCQQALAQRRGPIFEPTFLALPQLSCSGASRSVQHPLAEPIELERTRNEFHVKAARDHGFWVQGTLRPWENPGNVCAEFLWWTRRGGSLWTHSRSR